MSAMGMGEQVPYLNIFSNVDISYSGFNPQHQVYTGLQLQRPVWFSDLYHLSSLSLGCLGPTEDSVVQTPRPLGPYNKWNVRIWVIIEGSVTGQLCSLGPQVPELGVWLWFYDPNLTLCYSSNGRDSSLGSLCMVFQCFCVLLWSTLSMQRVETIDMRPDFIHRSRNFQDLCLLCSCKPENHALILPVAGTNSFPGLASEAGLSLVSLLFFFLEQLICCSNSTFLFRYCECHLLSFQLL